MVWRARTAVACECRRYRDNFEHSPLDNPLPTLPPRIPRQGRGMSRNEECILDRPGGRSRGAGRRVRPGPSMTVPDCASHVGSLVW